MSQWVNKYVQKINETTVDRSIPLEILVKVFHVSKRDPEEHQLIRNRLIERYLGTVTNHATQFSQAAKIPLGDLLSEGNYLLAEYFSKPDALTQKSPVSNLITGIVRNGLVRYILNTILDNLDKEPLTNVPEINASSILKYNEQNSWKTIYSDFEEFDRTIRERLTESQYQLFTLHHTIYGVGMTLGEIKDYLGLKVSIQTMATRYRKAFLRVENVTGIDFSEAYSYLDFEFAEPEYSGSTIEHLNQQLVKKQGIDLSRLVTGLDLNAQEFYSFVRGACGVSMSKTQQQELMEQYSDSPPAKLVDTKTELNALREKIKGMLGLEPIEFMMYTNILEEDFVRFLQSQFPSVKEEKIRRIITLSQQEKSDKKEFPTERVELSEIELLDRVLNLLRQDRYNMYLSNAHPKLPERMKHAYFPLYIYNPSKCMSLLEEKLAEFSGSSMYNNIREVYDFFRKSEQLGIERLKTTLDDFQKIDVLTLAEKKRHILASETGVGKTLEIIAAAEYLDVERVLIITNKSSTTATWYSQIREHVGDEAVVITGDDKDKTPLMEKAKSSKWVVVTYETYQRMVDQFNTLKPQMVVVDEADIMNNPGSLRTQAILDTDAEYKYTVSGWIFKNKRSELWPILSWLYPSEFPFRKGFAQEYCRGEWGRLKLKYELSHRLIFRPKSLVLPHLGTPQMNTINVIMSPEEREQYEKAEANFVEWYTSNYETGLPSVVTMSKLHSLRRLALKPKFEVLYQTLDERHKEPNKSVVSCSYVDEAMKIAADLNEMGMKVGYFDGQTSGQGRHEVIDRFNRDPDYDVLVMTEAGGKSITLTSADYLYFFNPVWTHSLKKQIIDRLHRRGQTRGVHGYELITRGTLEENIAAKTEEKRKEYERTVMDTHGYTSWFEENQEDIINSVIGDLVKKR